MVQYPRGGKMKIEAKPTELQKRNRIKAILVIMLVIFAIIKLTIAKTDSKVVVPIPRETMTLDQFILLAADDKIGKSSSTGKSRVEGISETTDMKYVYIDASAASSNKCTREIKHMMNVLTKDEEFLKLKGITFRYSFSATDKYGKVSKETGLVITFKQPNFTKIQWDNMKTENIKVVADYYSVSKFLNK